MAKATRARRPRQPDAPTRLIDAALHLAAVQGWSDTTMADIAETAKVPLAEARRHFASKQALLTEFFARLDAAMLEGVGREIADEPARDRLFDLIMRRFDAMAPYKDGIRAIAHEQVRDPAALFCLAVGPMRRSLDWMLAGARVRPWGPLQPMQRKGLGLIFLGAMRTWLRDDSPDLSKTMAAVDRGLARADSVLRMLPIGPSRRAAEDATTTESPG